MNQEFIKKMIKAKRLEYEAIKEIMPDKIKNKIEDIEKDAFNLLKDIAIEIVKEEVEVERENNSSMNNKGSKKINVDFN